MGKGGYSGKTGVSYKSHASVDVGGELQHTQYKHKAQKTHKAISLGIKNTLPIELTPRSDSPHRKRAILHGGIKPRNIFCKWLTTCVVVKVAEPVISWTLKGGKSPNRITVPQTDNTKNGNNKALVKFTSKLQAPVTTRRNTSHLCPEIPKPKLCEITKHATIATIHWEALEIPCSYKVRWKRNENSSQEEACHASYFTLTGLESASIYSVQVAAVSRTVTGEYSEELKFNTAPLSPHSLEISSRENSLAVKFKDDDATEKKYEILVQSTDGEKELIVKTRECFSVVGGLIPGNSYNVCIVAVKNGVSSHPCRSLYPVQTVPEKVVGMKVENISLLVCEISWKPTRGAESYIVRFEANDEENHTEISTKRTRCTLENLEPAESYTIAVAAVNSAGPGRYSEPKSFNTDVLPPRRIDVKVKYLEHSATLEVKILGAIQKAREYIVGEMRDRFGRVTTRKCDAIFSNLPHNSTYTVYVVAVGENGLQSKKRLSEKISIGNRPVANAHRCAHRTVDRSIFVRNVVVGDGVIYTRERDAPGQNCQYIPPGNHNSEKYRLGTFSVYPNDVPVNATDMAAAGFYFTGYKDRVKCFSCGIAVENWMLGDDVMDKKWHKSDCRMAFGRDERNISIPTPNSRSIFRMITGKHANVQGVPSLALGHKNYAQAPARNSGFENFQAATVNSTPNDITDVTTTFRRVHVSDSYPSLVLANVLSVEHESLLRSLNLKSEADRRRTYLQWPSYPAPYLPTDLAKDGFFYLGNLDRTQCFSCSGVLRNWAPYDNAREQHEKHFPNCRIVRMMDSGNIPLADDNRKDADEAELVRISALLPSTDALVEPPDPSPEEQRHLAEYFPCTAGVNIHMQRIEKRIETFARGWPRERVRASPEAIAKAGFFYLGEGDKTKCFYCNGGLQNWETNDEPWTEHAKWFPGCEFVLRRKGVEFVRRLAEAHPNLNRPYIRNPVSFDIPPREVERTSSNLSVASQQGLDLDHVESMGFSRKQIDKAIQLKPNRGGLSTTQELIEGLLKQNSGNVKPSLPAAQAGQKRNASTEPSETIMKRTRSTSPSSFVGGMDQRQEGSQCDNATQNNPRQEGERPLVVNNHYHRDVYIAHTVNRDSDVRSSSKRGTVTVAGTTYHFACR